MKKLSRKTVKHTVLALCLGLISVLATTSCDKLQRLRVDELIEVISNLPCDCIMDTLKGEWEWYRTYGGMGGGTWNNGFKSVVKILGQNNDGSINYEVWVRDTVPFFLPDGNLYYGIFAEDTLFSQGSLQIQYDPFWDNRCIIIELPHYNPNPFEPNTWRMYFNDIPWLGGNPSKDTLVFGHKAADGYYYFYKRIK